MKKKIPKFDQKAWDEKQAKVAEEANGGGSFNPTDWLKRMSESYEKLLGGQVVLGQDRLTIHTPKDKLSAKFPPSGINSGAALRARQPTGYLPYVPVGDPYDKYLFGGEDGERDYKLPQGIGQYTYGDWVNGSDPAFKQEERCCKPEDKVNVGFMRDKWACKVCGKDM